MASNRNQGREAREARERLKRYNARQAVNTHQLARRKRDNLLAAIGILVIAALATGTQIFYFTSGPGAPTAEPSASASATPTSTATPEANVGDVPSTDVAQERSWTGELTLNDTTLGYELDGAVAPQAVASFVQSTNDGYYDDKTCHRQVESATAHLLQCGSIDGTGAGDPEYAFGPIENAPADDLYPTGTIAVARGGSAYSNGRQFFIVYDDTTLDGSTGGYSVIGRITSGLDDLAADITDAGVASGGASAEDGAPATETTITELTIE